MSDLQTDEPHHSPTLGERFFRKAKNLRRNIWTFIVLYLIFSFTHGIQGSYTSSVLTTLEKNFNLPSALSSIIVTIATLGYMSSAISVSFFLAHKHHVRLFAVCMLVTGCCGLIYSLPHFIYKDYQINDESALLNSSHSKNHVEVMCITPTENESSNKNIVDFCENSLEKKVDISPNYVALLMFCVSEVVHGAAGACLWTVGFSFIDDNMPVHVASKLIGIMFLMRFVSPIISSAIGSSFLSLHTDLIETNLTPSHPNWIGAWWLGYLICFVINITISIPTFLLPEKFDNAQKHEFRPAGKDAININDERGPTEKAIKIYHNKNFKDLCTALMRLLRNPIFMFLTIGICFDCYILAFYAYLPKYVEVYFQMTAWMASLIGVMIPATAGGVMSYVGGVVSGNLKPSADLAVAKNMTLTFAASVLNVFILLFIMLIRCPTNNFPHGYSEVWKNISLDLECNTNCSCPPDAFDPVCGSDHTWYVSPCHAGCSDLSTTNNGPSMYRNCSCVNDGLQIADLGYCNDSCSFILIVYTVGLIFFCFVNNIYNVPATNVLLKCVDEEDKSLALGLQLILICLAMFPSPLIYGQLIDWVCILWKTSPCTDAKGSCSAYDHTMFRLVLHGNTMIWRVLAAVFYSLALFFSWKKHNRLKMEKLEEKSLQDRVDDYAEQNNQVHYENHF